VTRRKHEATALLDAAHELRGFPEYRELQNKLLAASWEAQRASGKGPWEVR